MSRPLNCKELPKRDLLGSSFFDGNGGTVESVVAGVDGKTTANQRFSVAGNAIAVETPSKSLVDSRNVLEIKK